MSRHIPVYIIDAMRSRASSPNHHEKPSEKGKSKTKKNFCLRWQKAENKEKVEMTLVGCLTTSRHDNHQKFGP